MEFLAHLPKEIIIGLVIGLIGLCIWAFRIIYSLIKDRISLFDNKIDTGFKDVRDMFKDVSCKFDLYDKKIDLLFIEIKSSDFANDHFLSNGERYMDIKETEKQRLIRDYEFQNI